jgi:Putative peptidoglycan binding domain/N-acetylmuramoyl-L-alanine amidase
MARMPGAVWKPLPKGFGTPMARYDLVIIHTMVGSLAGTDGYFRGGGTSSNSHFGTGGAGEIWQWGDTAKRSAASGAANPRSISIENADMGPGFPAWNTKDGNAVPPLAAQQVEANARICAWAHTQHGVPLERVPDSKPGRRGIAYHRLGVPGYAVAGGELWSSARGKVCPAPKRIAQVDLIIARARQLVGASASSPAPAPPSVPAGAGTLRRGDTGPAVLALQQFMTKAFGSYNTYTPNSTFGPATEAGVKEFQRRTGLPIDGVVGPVTVAKMRAYGFNG